MLTWHS